jgi:hypothetical protein
MKRDGGWMANWKIKSRGKAIQFDEKGRRESAEYRVKGPEGMWNRNGTRSKIEKIGSRKPKTTRAKLIDLRLNKEVNAKVKSN